MSFFCTVCSSVLILVSWGLSLAAPDMHESNLVIPKDWALPVSANFIRGEVVTERGRPLEGAVVSIKNVFNKSLRTTLTTENGEFIVKDLAAGRYLVAASADGYVMHEPEIKFDKISTYPLGSSVRITLIKGGVITGRILNAKGQPVVGAKVRAVRSRDMEGRPIAEGNLPLERQTDDRGIYRIYGLPAGMYLVAVAGSAQTASRFNVYDYDAPVFYPSSSVTEASLVRVQPSSETTGIDILYRAENGYTISGQVTSGLPSQPVSVFLTLHQAGLSAPIFISSKLMDSKNNSFVLHGIPSGEYYLLLRARNATVDAFGTRKIEVKGRDVTGINATLFGLGSVNGLVTTEAASLCSDAGAVAVDQIVIRAERLDSSYEEDLINPFISNRIEVGVNSERRFAFNGLKRGRYRVEPWLNNETWYVKSIALRSNETTSLQKNINPEPATNVANKGMVVTAGQALNNLVVHLSSGAATVQGSIITSKEKTSSVARIFLVPATPNLQDDVLRYSEALTDREGKFVLKNIAPGSYRILAQDSADRGSVNRSANMLDSKVRLALQHLAQQEGKPLELKQCQRVNDLELPFPQ